MADVFISYRRTDAGGHAGRLYERLSQRLGAAQVFFDVASISGGEVWRESLRRHLERCRVLLAVIGPDWLTAQDPDGTLRLSNPADVVRTEIITAVNAGKVIIPVLVGGGLLPVSQRVPNDWPSPLQAIGERQAIRIGHDTFDSDVLQLESRLLSSIPRLKVIRQDEPGILPRLRAAVSWLAWPAVVAALMTWATNRLFIHFNLDPLIGRELALVFLASLVVSTVIVRILRRSRSIFAA